MGLKRRPTCPECGTPGKGLCDRCERRFARAYGAELEIVSDGKPVAVIDGKAAAERLRTDSEGFFEEIGGLL